MNLYGENSLRNGLTTFDITGKLNHMVEVDGSKNILTLVSKYAYEKNVLGICSYPSCDFITVVSPDEEHARCMACKTDTVISLFKLIELL